MSAIPPMDATMSRHAMPTPETAGPGGAEPGHPFSDVMRSAVIAAPKQHSTAKPLGATTSARVSHNRSATDFKAPMNSQNAPARTAARQTPDGDIGTRASDQDRQNPGPSPDIVGSSGVPDPRDVSLLEAKTSSSVPTGDAGDRSCRVASQQAPPDHTQTGSSASRRGRKQISPSKVMDVISRVSASSADAAPIVMTTVPATMIVPVSAANLPAAKSPEETPNASKTALAATRGAKPIEARIVPVDSSFSSTAMASRATACAQKADGSAAATGFVPDAADISTDGTADPQRSATSAADQNSAPVESSGGSQSTSSSGVTATHAGTNGISNSAANADVSNAVTATGSGNSSAGGIDPVRSGGDQTATSVHGSDGSKSSSLSAALPLDAAAAKHSAGPNENLPGPGLRLHDNAGLVSAAGHSGASGSFPSSAVGSTAAHGTISDTFAAIDSGAIGERGVLLHALPHQVAVGVSDPTLGWVEVRAERVSGQIAAALTTSSSASHAALTSVLPTMATYLQDHQAGVHQVHVETSLGGGQAGAGSHRQSSSQGEARTFPDNFTASKSVTNSWNSLPEGSTFVATGQRSNYMHEGHQFSIRA